MQSLRPAISHAEYRTESKIITYPWASIVAQSLTIDRNFARISSSQESARINAFHHVFASHPLSHDRGFKRSAIANIYNNRLTPNKHAVKHQPAKKVRPPPRPKRAHSGLSSYQVMSAIDIFPFVRDVRKILVNKIEIKPGVIKPTHKLFKRIKVESVNDFILFLLAKRAG